MKIGRLLLLAMLSLSSATAFADNFADASMAIVSHTSSVMRLITLLCYLVAMVAGVAAVVKFMAHRKNPEHTKVKTPIILFIVCLAALYVPSMFHVAGATMYGGEGMVSMSGTASVAGATSFDAAQSSNRSAAVSGNEQIASAPTNKSDLLTVQQNTSQQLDIVRNFALTLTADYPDQVFTQIRDITNKNGGMVTNSDNTLSGDHKYSGSMDISVPEDKVNDVINAIHHLPVVFETETMTADEVSAQHADLQAQIATTKAVQVQYINLLNQAKSIDDIIQLTDIIADLQTQILSLTANLSQLSDDINYVKIHITIYLPVVISEPASGWTISATFIDAANSLLMTMETLATIAIWFMIYLCPLLLLGVLLYLPFRPLIRKGCAYCKACVSAEEDN